MAKAAAKTALAVDLMNSAISTLAETTRGFDLPDVTAETWGSWVDGLINSRYENQFYQQLVDTIYQNIVSKAIYENSLREFKAGSVNNGAGVRETFIDKIDAMPYATTSVEKKELKTYLADIYESRYLVNMQRDYPVTLGRVQFRGYVSSPERVIDLIDTIKSMLFTSNEMDEYGLMKTLIQAYILSGKAYIVPVDMTDGLTDFAVQYRKMSFKLAGVPTRKYNEYGVMNNTPKDRQVLFLPSEVAARFQVTELSSAFNIDYVNWNTAVKVLEDLDEPYSELPKLRAINPSIPNIDAAASAALAPVVGVLMDREFFKVYDVINEMWDKERGSMMDVNYFLHLMQIFATSPFANIVVFVSGEATEQPATLTVNVVSKSANANYTDYVLEVKHTANSLVGGALNFIQTEEAAEAGIMVTKTGFIRIPASAASGVTLTGEIRGTVYTAAKALTLSSNVGDTITFNKAE